MAYRLERDESVTQGLRRVICEEMESASDHLSGKKETTRDEAIHDARKSIKKIRALLRLTRHSLGKTYARENAQLGDIARRLSDFRDAFALIKTFDSLKKEYRGEMSARSVASVRAGLARRRRETEKAADVDMVVKETADALRKALKRLKAWPLPNDGFDSIAPGLELTYRRGRKALARVRRNATAENYHDLRKRVKDHWYHIRLMEGLWTEMMVAYEKSLKDLETWLGDDHNLAVLREKIAAEPPFYGSAEDTALTLRLIEQHQEQLRGKGVALAERIYEEKPREFLRRMKHLWNTWRHDPKDAAAA